MNNVLDWAEQFVLKDAEVVSNEYIAGVGGAKKAFVEQRKRWSSWSELQAVALELGGSDALDEWSKGYDDFCERVFYTATNQDMGLSGVETIPKHPVREGVEEMANKRIEFFHELADQDCDFMIKSDDILEQAMRSPHYFQVRGFIEELKRKRSDLAEGYISKHDLVEMSIGRDCSKWVKEFLKSWEEEEAKRLISAFCLEEYGENVDFSDMTKIQVAYTELGEEYHCAVDVYFDLENYKETVVCNGYDDSWERVNQYDSLGAMIKMKLEGLDYSDLVQPDGIYDFVDKQELVGAAMRADSKRGLLESQLDTKSDLVLGNEELVFFTERGGELYIPYDGNAVHSLSEYVDSFDLDYETYIWLDSQTGHAPEGMSIRDLYDDLDNAIGTLRKYRDECVELSSLYDKNHERTERE